jgi:hypothetical protein
LVWFAFLEAAWFAGDQAIHRSLAVSPPEYVLSGLSVIGSVLLGDMRPSLEGKKYAAWLGKVADFKSIEMGW